MNATQRQTAEIGVLPDSAAVEISALLSLAGYDNTRGGSLNLPQAQRNCLRRCEAHKVKADAYVRWISQTQNLHAGNAIFNPTKLNRIASCGSILQFRQYHEADPPKIVLTNSNDCKQHLHCALCAMKRAAKTVRKYDEKCKILTTKNPDLELHFAVLTIENKPDFGEAFDCVSNAVRTMFQNRNFGRYAREGNTRHLRFLDAALIDVAAGAYSIEVKRGKRSGKWHPHVNLLLLCEKGRLDYDKVHEEWQKLTKQEKETQTRITLKDAFADDKKVFLEIFKYALKFSEMSFEDRYATGTALFRRNLSGCFGDFRGLDVDNDNTLEPEDLPYLLLLYRYQARYRKYFLERIESKVPSKKETWGSIIVNVAKALEEGGLCECATA
jgi:plasmid rolling circle replication initiator protein Rep